MKALLVEEKRHHDELEAAATAHEHERALGSVSPATRENLRRKQLVYDLVHHRLQEYGASRVAKPGDDEQSNKGAARKEVLQAPPRNFFVSNTGMVFGRALGLAGLGLGAGTIATSIVSTQYQSQAATAESQSAFISTLEATNKTFPPQIVTRYRWDNEDPDTVKNATQAWGAAGFRYFQGPRPSTPPY